MRKKDLLLDPLEQFKQWYEKAKVQEDPNLDSMVLATVSTEGKPSVRVVLYKGISQGGFLIYTNYHSRKAQDLLANPSAALVFYWPKIYRQVRIEGEATKITKEESQQYFDTRHFESKIAAWVSEQSQTIPNREHLIKRHQKYRKEFKRDEVRCPDFWGGFRISPISMEFWIGREYRLHDRFLYTKTKAEWEIVRLAP